MVNDNLAYQVAATPEHEILIDEAPVKWCTVSLSEIIERGKRLEASVYDVEAKQAHEIIADGKYYTRWRRWYDNVLYWCAIQTNLG